MNELLMLAGGNPGAITCLIGMTTGEIAHAVAGLTIVPKIKELDIKGTDLYVLWSDISNKNYDLMAYLCEHVPDDLLKNASSKQDYSGRVMLQHWINKFGLIQAEKQD